MSRSVSHRALLSRRGYGQIMGRMDHERRPHSLRKDRPLDKLDM